jgi:catechol-2,3-dioxygenase
MGKRFYGAVLAVRNLDGIRRFYSDVVGLGEPVVDSSFWIEYEVVPGGMVLALERNELALVADSGDSRNGNTSWCLQVADLPAFEQQMVGRGFGPQSSSELPSGCRALTFRDPEGNPFMVIAAGGKVVG